MMSARSSRRGKVTAAVLLATGSLAALLVGMPRAAAEECAGQAAPPADLATPSQVFDTLRTRTSAEMLAISFLRKPVEQTCAWIYEVKVVTASGSVVELDLDAEDLALVGARGPENDRDAAALVKQIGGDGSVLTTSAAKSDAKGSDTASGRGKGGSGEDGGGDDGGNHGGNDGGEGGEGGNSGSGGGGDSGSGGGDDGGHDGGDGGGGGEGGDGGEGGGVD